MVSIARKCGESFHNLYDPFVWPATRGFRQRLARDAARELLEANAIQLIALTFVRTKELIEAEWREIDLMVNLWRIPPERMKMDTAHIVL